MMQITKQTPLRLSPPRESEGRVGRTKFGKKRKILRFFLIFTVKSLCIPNICSTFARKSCKHKQTRYEKINDYRFLRRAAFGSRLQE